MRICNLKVLLIKMGISLKDLSSATNISSIRLVRLMNEPEEPKDWEAKIIAECLDLPIKSIWPAYVPTEEGESK